MGRYYFRIDVAAESRDAAEMRGLFDRVADALFERDDIEDADVATDFGKRTVTLSMVIPDARDGEDAFARACAVARAVAAQAGMELPDDGSWMLTAYVGSVSVIDEFAAGIAG